MIKVIKDIKLEQNLDTHTKDSQVSKLLVQQARIIKSINGKNNK